jgi:hypothetical protein
LGETADEGFSSRLQALPFMPPQYVGLTDQIVTVDDDVHEEPPQEIVAVGGENVLYILPVGLSAEVSFSRVLYQRVFQFNRI